MEDENGRIEQNSEDVLAADDIPHQEIEVMSPEEMLRQFDGVNVAAPMVRYSRLAARMLFSRYNVHIINTPMMLAREFSRSEKARRADFSTNDRERGVFNLNGRTVRGRLVAQFAAKCGKDFADAVELISPYVDGVDLNCGCPQKWAYKEEIGSYLLRQPDTVRDIVRQARNRMSCNYSISIKIRLDSDPKLTTQLIQTAIHAGASYIGVHGRTRHQRDSEPVNLEGIRFAREEAKGAVPIIGNGDVFSLQDSIKMREETGVTATMSARGLLENPALFAGYNKTPWEAVDQFLDIASDVGLDYTPFHRHVAWMVEKRMPNKSERIKFNAFRNRSDIVQYLEEHRPSLFSHT